MDKNKTTMQNFYTALVEVQDVITLLKSQSKVLVSEIDEMIEAVEQKDLTEFIDALGDIVYVKEIIQKVISDVVENAVVSLEEGGLCKADVIEVLNSAFSRVVANNNTKIFKVTSENYLEILDYAEHNGWKLKDIESLDANVYIDSDNKIRKPKDYKKVELKDLAQSLLDKSEYLKNEGWKV